MKKSNFTIIKDKEFAVLCVLSGIDHFFGSMDLSKYSLGRQEIYTVLYNLYKKDILVEEEKRLALVPDIAELFDLLRAADRMISLVNPLTSENHVFYYKEGEAIGVNIQKTWEEPNSLKLRKVALHDMTRICEEEELFPKQILIDQTNQEIRTDTADEITKECLEVSIYDLNKNEVLSKVSIRIEGLNEILCYEDEHDQYKEVYELKKLKAFIDQFAQGGKAE